MPGRQICCQGSCVKGPWHRLRGLRWTNIEILPNYQGKPEVKLSGSALELAADLGIDKIMVSISHDRGRAVAFAVAVGKEG
ncbi:hypothetical protein N752_20895 [Desulforamulus aquiferis]|nr:hypothetical protein N752_20895 [Desulforamulus aquiferis]